MIHRSLIHAVTAVVHVSGMLLVLRNRLEGRC